MSNNAENKFKDDRMRCLIMNLELEKYFEINEEAFYTNSKGERCFRGVDGDPDNTRRKMAKNQAKNPPVPYSKVICYVNELLEKIKNNVSEKSVTCSLIELDGIQQLILDNGIIVTGCNWEEPEWDSKQRKYISYDKKYDIIKEKFNLTNPYDIVWLKFTKSGHLGVVGKSFDINYDYNYSSGKLIKQENEEWDESFVLIFPLTPEILKERKNGDIELAIGNYLILNKVPIIDYYSHNN